MARKSARPGRTVAVFFIGAGDRLRPGGARRHLEARARPRPPGRHPDHADRQGQRRPQDNLNEAADIIDSASTAPVSPRPRSPPRAATRSWSRSPARPSTDLVETVEAAGAAALPPGRRRCAAEPRGATDAAAARRPRSPGAGVTAAAGARARRSRPSRRPSPPARTGRRPLLGKDQNAKNKQPTSSRAQLVAEPDDRAGAATSRPPPAQVHYTAGEQDGVRRRR